VAAKQEYDTEKNADKEFIIAYERVKQQRAEWVARRNMQNSFGGMGMSNDPWEESFNFQQPQPVIPRDRQHQPPIHNINTNNGTNTYNNS